MRIRKDIADRDKDLPPEMTLEMYHKELYRRIKRIEDALAVYSTTQDSSIRDDAKKIMDRQMQLIVAPAREYEKALGGFHKHFVQVERNYKRYMESQAPEILTALQQDLDTLREFSQLPLTQR